jgi:uncharacterized protein with HEPN domain
MSRDSALLLDILLAARDAVGFVEEMDRDAFLGDRRTQYAVIRCLEVIGEAGKKVSPGIRSGLADVPWTQMARTRDLLIHSYAKVDGAEVFLTVRRDLPALIAALEPLGLEESGQA